MILTKQELFPVNKAPFVDDRETGTRVATFFGFLAASWFFVSPWSFFGLSEQTDAWNNWGVGALLIAFTIFRMVAPRASYFFVYANMVGGLWIMLSPFVFGYFGDTPRLTNSIGCGAVILVCSLVARMHTVRVLGLRRFSSQLDDVVDPNDPSILHNHPA